MSYANLLYEVEDSIAQVTVNRPEKLNPLNGETVAALGRCFGDIAADDAGLTNAKKCDIEQHKVLLTEVWGHATRETATAV